MLMKYQTFKEAIYWFSIFVRKNSRVVSILYLVFILDESSFDAALIHRILEKFVSMQYKIFSIVVTTQVLLESLFRYNIK